MIEHALLKDLGKELKVNILMIVAYLYVFFLCVLLIKAVHNVEYLKKLFDDFNSLPFHILGLISLAIIFIRTFKNQKTRQLALYKLKLVFSEHKNFDLLQDEAVMDYLTEQEVQKSLMEFSIDAREIMIFAGDSDFLITNDGTKSDQFEELKKFGNKCKLLVSEHIKVEVISLLKELNDHGVRIRVYPKSKPNLGLRGRIKVADDSISVRLFDKIKGNYLAQELKNRYLVEMLCQEYNDVFDKGKNPFIKYILFDLAGVYCDGDFQIFLEAVKEKCAIEIKNKNDNYLCVDERLNLGTDNFTIIEYIEEKGSRMLTLDERKIIRQTWNSTWSLNILMKELAYKLKGNGYRIAVCSNCDEDNGELYLTRNYFDGFDKFFSYEMKILKPNEEYFQKVIEKYKCQPFECLFIDDHEKNIDAADKFGFQTIKVARSHSEEEKVSKLMKEFSLLSIKHD